jgi:hypothetical protein
MTADRAGRDGGPTATWVVATVLAALGVHALLAWLARDPGILTRQDDAIYLILARSIRQGGYHEMFRVDAPVHEQYPPLYPALLALWGGVLGDRFDTLVTLTILASTATLGLLFIALRRVMDVRLAVVAILVLAVNPSLVMFAGSIRSEPPYMLVALLTLVMLGRPAPRAAGIGIACAIAAALIRSIGATLLIALALHWLLERRWKALLGFAAACLLVVGPWMLWTALSPEQRLGSSYIAELRGIGGGSRWIPPFGQRLWLQMIGYATDALPTNLAVPTIRGTPIDNLVAVLIITATGLAGLLAWWKAWRLAVLYVLSYAALIAAWVWYADRFVIPLLVLVVPAMLVGARSIAARIRPGWGPTGVAVVALTLGATGLSRSIGTAWQRSTCDRSSPVPDADCMLRDQASYFEALRYIEQNTSPAAIFLTLKPEPLYVYTGRRSVGWERALAEPKEQFLEHLRAQDVEYILLGSLQFREPLQLAGYLEPECRSLELVSFFPQRTYLFRIREPEDMAISAPDSIAAAACAAVARYRAANVGRDFERDP